MQGNTAWLEDPMTFIDGLLRVSFDMLQDLVGYHEIERFIRNVEGENILLRIINLDDLRRTKPYDCYQHARVADGKRAAGFIR